ncbi:APC family permease [Fodinicola feengrottensis]|uniref:APC family permease n=1 Tax=Fodinicola feengrottensis TaxID=435914 RepID=UPI0036F384EE
MPPPPLAPPASSPPPRSAIPGSTLSGIAAAAAIAAYSFLGFDAITTLTEETRDPERTVPKAIVLVTIIGGVIFVVASYATQLVASSVHIKDPNSAAFEIAAVIGGRLFSAIFLAGLVITQFASGIAAQASASRLLYAMGRDSVLPKKIFGFVNERFHTPLINILLTGAVGLIGIFLDISTAASFINFFARFHRIHVRQSLRDRVRAAAADPTGPGWMDSQLGDPADRRRGRRVAADEPGQQRPAYRPLLVGHRSGDPGLPDPRFPAPAPRSHLLRVIRLLRPKRARSRRVATTPRDRAGIRHAVSIFDDSRAAPPLA